LLPGDTGSWSTYINSSGQIAGCSDTSNSQAGVCNWMYSGDAFVWSSTTELQSLGTLSGDAFSVGYFISDSGAIVGESWNVASQTGQGFLWTKSGGMIGLGTLPGGSSYSDADQITAKGVIVGESAVSNGDVHAVLWTKSGSTYQIHDEGTLPGAPYSYPYSINNSNQVVGVAYFNAAGTTFHAFLWSKAGGWKDLGTLPGGKNSVADWINDAGQMVGQSTSSKFPNGVATLWDPSGTIHTLGTLPGGTTSYAGYISAAGEVVGESDVPGGETHAFILAKTGKMQDLNDLISSGSGWVLNHASAMNSAGQIVGFGTVNGAVHGFLLTP
jgi:probable HAF family extracellular repeat protein